MLQAMGWKEWDPTITVKRDRPRKLEIITTVVSLQTPSCKDQTVTHMWIKVQIGPPSIHCSACMYTCVLQFHCLLACVCTAPCLLRNSREWGIQDQDFHPTLAPAQLPARGKNSSPPTPDLPRCSSVATGPLTPADPQPTLPGRWVFRPFLFPF